MSRVKYQILRVLAALPAVAASSLLALILFWLTFGGVVGCGRGIFDSPAWPLEAAIFVGLPAGLLMGAVALARHCSRCLWLR